MPDDEQSGLGHEHGKSFLLDTLAEEQVESLLADKHLSKEGKEFARDFCAKVMEQVPEEASLSEIREIFAQVTDTFPQEGREGKLYNLLEKSIEFRLRNLEEAKDVAGLQSLNSPLLAMVGEIKERYASLPDQPANNSIITSVVSAKRFLSRMAEEVPERNLSFPDPTVSGIFKAFLEEKFSIRLREELATNPEASLKKLMQSVEARMNPEALTGEFADFLKQVPSVRAVEQAVQDIVTEQSPAERSTERRRRGWLGDAVKKLRLGVTKTAVLGTLLIGMAAGSPGVEPQGRMVGDQDVAKITFTLPEWTSTVESAPIYEAGVVKNEKDLAVEVDRRVNEAAELLGEPYASHIKQFLEDSKCSVEILPEGDAWGDLITPDDPEIELPDGHFIMRVNAQAFSSPERLASVVLHETTHWRNHEVFDQMLHSDDSQMSLSENWEHSVLVHTADEMASYATQIRWSDEHPEFAIGIDDLPQSIVDGYRESDEAFARAIMLSYGFSSRCVISHEKAPEKVVPIYRSLATIR
ncbi:TPA: hypothetical protein DIU46_01260 [Patescibacteria group bacterium]|nr:hypothetical protein [Patescibacteria group bacterium]HCR42584.1 hypothetical protein [Patescibacteria group bacterium]